MMSIWLRSSLPIRCGKDTAFSAASGEVSGRAKSDLAPCAALRQCDPATAPAAAIRAESAGASACARAAAGRQNRSNRLSRGASKSPGAAREPTKALLGARPDRIRNLLRRGRDETEAPRRGIADCGYRNSNLGARARRAGREPGRNEENGAADRPPRRQHRVLERGARVERRASKPITDPAESACGRCIDGV